MLRTVPFTLALMVSPFAAAAQSADPALVADPIEYELGGATAPTERRSATLAFDDDARSGLLPFRFPDRAPTASLRDGRTDTGLGELTIFAGEDIEAGRDTLRLGTALTQGNTTTGFSLTYREDTAPARSEVFIDVAITEALSLGVSGILSTDSAGVEDAVKSIGLSAAYTMKDGTFLQGGIADANETDPVFGVSMGLRF
jgi:hypothetical protein